MKIRDLDIAFKLKTQTTYYLAHRVVAILEASVPDGFIDEQSILNRLDGGEAPSSIINEVTQATGSAHAH
jgi:hypothetical protein